MKKLVLFIAVLLISGMSYGQFHIGPQIGYTASNLSVNVDSISNSLKSNFLIGVFARFGEKIYVQPEINWLTQGSVFKYPKIGNLSPIEQNVKLSTIQIPLNVGWRMINLKIINLRIFAGIAANFVVNTNIKTTGGDENYYVDVKYMGGLTNIFDDFQIENNTITSKSNLFVVTLGWKIL